jgi:hypothetical protein
VRLVRGGGKVVLCDLQSSSGHTVAKELGENVIFVPTDVRYIYVFYTH